MTRPARDDIPAGGPIDTRRNPPRRQNNLAQEKGMEWFRNNVIMKVPAPHAGMMRDVYPGFLQLGGFMTMNLDRHVDAHRELFWHLVEGDGDSAEKHREFYADEYMSVMDLTAEFYLQTVEKVFVNHDLPKSTLTHRNTRVDPSKITRTALMTIEGERDDISGVVRRRPRRTSARTLPRRRDSTRQPGVGHYGVFNGSRFKEIVPNRRVRE